MRSVVAKFERVNPTEHKGHMLYGQWVAVDNWSARVSETGVVKYPDADGSNAEWEIDGCATCEGTEDDFQ